MTKKFLLKVSVFFFVISIAVISMWVIYMNALQQTEEMKQQILAQSKYLTDKLQNVIDDTYTKEMHLINGKIKSVSRRIFAERPVMVKYEESNLVANHSITTKFLIHGAVEEQFFEDCIDIDPEIHTITINYDYSTISLIAEIIDRTEINSSLYNAGEYLKGVSKDAQRLFEMTLTGQYVSPEAIEDYWQSNIEILKKYEWQEMSEQFEKTIINELGSYDVIFIKEIPQFSESEILTIQSWEIG